MQDEEGMPVDERNSAVFYYCKIAPAIPTFVNCQHVGGGRGGKGGKRVLFISHI